jgi:hypothetical protein
VRQAFAAQTIFVLTFHLRARFIAHLDFHAPATQQGSAAMERLAAPLAGAIRRLILRFLFSQEVHGFRSNPRED